MPILMTNQTRPPNTFKTLAAASTASEATVWTPASGKRFRFMGFDLTGTIAGTYTFKDGTGLGTIYVTYLQADTPKLIAFGQKGLLSGAANRLLTCTGPGSSAITGTIFGTEEDSGQDE